MKDNLLRPDSVKKNYIFQFWYQVIVLVIPLIIYPYLTRVLGGEVLGIYTYTNSIASYFILFANLGINKHGQRIIAQRTGDVEKLRKTFWSLYFVHTVTSIIAVAAYVIYVVFVCKSDKTVAYAQTIYTISVLFDVNWVFYGLEKFKVMSLRNAAVRIVNLICIFLFVKSPADIIVYTVIMTATDCIGNIVVLPQVFSAIPPIKFSLEDLKEHVRPLLTLFAASVAVSLYNTFDKTLLGILSTKQSVAFYTYSFKIVSLTTVFISIISTVLHPRACFYAENKDWDNLKSNFTRALNFTYFIGLAFFFGLLAVARPFAVLYYGEEFAPCGLIIMEMCPLILICGIGETIRSQYIYPLKMDVTMLKITIINALTNLLISIILIPRIGITGAVLGSVLAEMVGFIMECKIVRMYYSLGNIVKSGKPYVICGALMYGAVRLVGNCMENSVLTILLQVLVGGVVYIGLFMLYSYRFNKDVFNYIIARFSR